jgi:hypothetical protein
LEANPQKDDFDSYRLARDFYRSCIDEERREEVGLRPLVQILQNLGGWPILEGDFANIVWLNQEIMFAESSIRTKHLGALKRSRSV